MSSHCHYLWELYPCCGFIVQEKNPKHWVQPGFFNSGHKTKQKSGKQTSQCLKIEKMHGHFHEAESIWLGTKKSTAPAWIPWAKKHSRLREGEFENMRVCTTLQKFTEDFPFSSSTLSTAASWKKLFHDKICLTATEKNPTKTKKQPNSKLDVLKSNQAVSPDMFQNRRKIFTN